MGQDGRGTYGNPKAPRVPGVSVKSSVLTIMTTGQGAEMSAADAWGMVVGHTKDGGKGPQTVADQDGKEAAPMPMLAVLRCREELVDNQAE